MSKKFKSQASSARAASATFGGPSFGFGVASGHQSSSSLSYISEQPDLSGISDPHVVVSLRNLGKKDSITKAKAIEELQEFAKTAEHVEDAFIAAWTDLYPRTSIDNSRRVRQLAHTLQGSLTVSAGKRIVPSLPKAVGAWLCGLYDNDRAVARSAQDALALAFPSEEKRQALWKVYPDTLLEYAEDAILVQTTSTLSDERTTSKDDAESKQSRVAGSAMVMLVQLVKSSTAKVRESRKMSQIVVQPKLWDYLSSDDPYLRRCTCSIAVLAGEMFALDLDWALVSSSIIGKALNTSQLGSATQLVDCILTLTMNRSELWTTDYSSKTAASKRLLNFVKKGSQRGSEAYWETVEALFKIIPQSVFTTNEAMSLADCSTVANAVRTGIMSSEEPRQNLNTAWSVYIRIGFWLADQLTDTTEQETLLENEITPIVLSYVQPGKESWQLPSQVASRLAASVVASLLDKGFETILVSLWAKLCDSLTQSMRISLPESSKDYSNSQKSVIAQSERFFKLKAEAVRMTAAPARESVRVGFETAYGNLTEASVELLRSRNGKPYGAAGVLQGLLQNTKVAKANPALISFLDEDVRKLLQSPSAERLVSIWQICGRPLKLPLQTLVLEPSLTEVGERTLTRLLREVSQDDIDSIPEIRAQLLVSPRGANASSLCFGVLENPNLLQSAISLELVDQFLDYLSPDVDPTQQSSKLQFLNSLLNNTTAKANFIRGPKGSEFLAKLILLEESPIPEISNLASSLLQTCKGGDVSKESGSSTSITIIRNQFSGAVPYLSVESLINLAVEELAKAIDKQKCLHNLLPTSEQWQTAQAPHMFNKRPYGFAITSPVQGAVYAVGSEQQTTKAAHDTEGLSLCYRLLLYVTKFMAHPGAAEALATDQAWALMSWLSSGLQLINEKLTSDIANEIWTISTPELVDEAVDVVSKGGEILSSWWSNNTVPLDDWLQAVIHVLGNDESSYIDLLSNIDITDRIIEREGAVSLIKTLEIDNKPFYKSAKLVRAATICCCFRDYLVTSAPNRKVLNELISSATSIPSISNDLEAFRSVILLNVLLNGDSSSLGSVSSQRLVFLMKTLVRLLGEANDEWLVVSEIFKLLVAVLPAIEDIYGEHWQEVLNAVVDIWQFGVDVNDDLPVLHSSFKLYQTLKKLSASEDVNEDLVDTWKASMAQLDQGLLHCLQLFTNPSKSYDKPRIITVELLGRLVADLRVQNIGDILPLMSSPDIELCKAAYCLLHREIPERQEELSLELALEKQSIHIPTELLTSLVDVPAINGDSKRTGRLNWLLSWQLVFDHFSKSSYRLREAYASNLKDMGQVSNLLDNICDIVRIKARPIDASKFDLMEFSLDMSETPEKEEQWLAVCLYYECLLYLPGLCKRWYRDQRNNTKTPLDSWTQKYISPSVVAASFKSVSDWAKDQHQDDSPVTVKTSAKGFEMVASMEIDPENPPISIAVCLPQNYPLDSPTVVGRTRVGVSEKNWRAWLQTFELIIFGTESIIEGLIAFRRSVQAALKGQGECAICYSIIGTDMQTPNKKCSTCKHTFHGSCLFRWFKSSNSSTCPLCRNAFNYA